MPVVQVPPAVGTSGQFIDAIVITSSTLREIIVIGDAVSSGAFATVSSSQGLQVSSTQSHTVISASSGLVQTLTSGPTTISGTVTILSASSGLIQTLTTGAYPVLTSGPLTLTGTVAIVSASSGLIQTLTTGAYQVLASGPQTIAGTVTVVNASSGLVQVLTTGTLLANLPNFSGAGAGVTSSAGLQVVAMPGSTGTILSFNYISSSSGNSNNVKGTAGVFYGFYAFNTTNAARYLKVYGTSSAPTLGSTAAQIGNYGIPSAGAAGAGAQHVLQPFGILATGGVSFAILSGVETTSTGIIGASDIGLTLYYI